MNTYNFRPRVFDARFHGVFTYKSVLEYHKSIADHMPEDGIIWLCERTYIGELVINKLQDRYTTLSHKVKELETGMKGQPYGVWTILDREAHLIKSRIQLIGMCIAEHQK